MNSRILNLIMAIIMTVLVFIAIQSYDTVKRKEENLEVAKAF